jgi:DNA-binding IclR family transcriptional regulator
VSQSVRKAITLLRATAEHGDGASVSALARTAGLPRVTALRRIQTMEGERLLQRVPGADRVVLGPELSASRGPWTRGPCCSGSPASI